MRSLTMFSTAEEDYAGPCGDSRTERGREPTDPTEYVETGKIRVR